MRRSKVLEKLRAGKVARICSFANFLPFVPKMAAHCGYDGIWVDGEHRPFDAREAQSLIAYHHLADIDCMWRPPTLEKTLLYRLFEDGAAGLMIPHVSTPERAQQLSSMLLPLTPRLILLPHHPTNRNRDLRC